MKERYRQRILSLVLSVVFLAITAFILFFVEPTFIQNLPPQHTYLALYLPLFIGLALACSFVLLHSRRGILLATLITTTLWLNQIRLFSIFNLIVLIAVLSCIELLLTRRS